MKTAVFLADGFEAMEAICPIDILRRAEVEVVTVSVSGKKEVPSSHGILIVADTLFAQMDFSDVEMLVLPGGMPGAANLAAHEGLRCLLLNFQAQGKRIAAICAAPAVVLGRLRLLTDKEAICYTGYETSMYAARISSKTVITDSNITTAQGPGVAMPFAIELVRLLKGQTAADSIKSDLIL